MTSLLHTCPPPAARLAGQSESERSAVRVVHVVLSLDFGGLERIVLSLVREAQRLGGRPAVVCLERPGTLAPAVEALGVPVRCVQKQPGKSFKVFGRLASVFEELGPEIVHTHQVGALFYSAGPARRLAQALVHTEHGKHYRGHWRKRLLGWCAGWRADRFFCVSSDIADEVCAQWVARRSRVVVVPNGVDVDAFAPSGDREARKQALGINSHAPVVGTIGRLSEIKRQDLLIQAFGRVLSEVPDAHLLIVGDGPMRSELEALAAKLGLANRVHFAGYQPRPEDSLTVMDVFALSSRSEGMPVSVLEAWAAKVPVVATDVGGLTELLRDDAGVLVPAGAEAGLADAISSILKDPAAAERLRRAGWDRVNSGFTVAQMAETYQRHYLQLLDRWHARGDHGS